MPRFLIPLTIALLAVPGCGESEDTGRFTREDAEAAARKIHEAMARGDAAATAALALAPVVFRDRTWGTDAEVAANLAKELPRCLHLLKGLDKVEVFSRSQLLKGQWPRNRDVEESKRALAVERLGVRSGGWLARVHSDSRAGYQLVLNPDAGTRLVLSGVIDL